MGAYIYRTTPSRHARITYRDNQTGELIDADCSIYEYAYKPYWSNEQANRRMEQRLVAPARRAFTRLNEQPHKFGITAHDDVITLGASVWRTRRNVSVNDTGWGDYYPYVGKLIAVKRLWGGFRVESMKQSLDAGQDVIHKYFRGGWPEEFHFRAIREGSDYVLSSKYGGIRGEMRLDVGNTDNERLLAHWNNWTRGG